MKPRTYCAAALLFACAVAASGAVLSGTVYDSVSSLDNVIIIVFARVELQTVSPGPSYTTIAVDTSDLEGNFSFANVADGSYSLLASAEQYRPGRLAVNVSGGASKAVDVRLPAIPMGTLSGTIRVGGLGIFSGLVEVKQGGTTLFSATSTSNGMYFFYSMLEVGVTYDITASYAGHQPVTVAHQQKTVYDTLDFDLVPSAVRYGARPHATGDMPRARITRDGFLHLTGLRSSGIVSVQDLAGKRLFQAKIDRTSSRVALPEAAVGSGTVRIIRVAGVQGEILREIVVVH